MRDKTPILAGLAVAWGGPAFRLTPIERRLGLTKVSEELALWLLLAIVTAIVVFWEKKPLASMGIRPFSWRSVGWGVLLAAVTIYVTIPALTWALRAAGIPAFEEGMAKILVLPLWLRAIAAPTAGVVEDALFIGYAFTRMELLTRSTWLAGTISVAVFSFLHFPHWGLGPALAYLIAVGIAVAFFAWRRDLLANIIAHVIVDGMGLVIVPALTA